VNSINSNIEFFLTPVGRVINGRGQEENTIAKRILSVVEKYLSLEESVNRLDIGVSPTTRYTKLEKNTVENDRSWANVALKTLKAVSYCTVALPLLALAAKAALRSFFVPSTTYEQMTHQSIREEIEGITSTEDWTNLLILCASPFQQLSQTSRVDLFGHLVEHFPLERQENESNEQFAVRKEAAIREQLVAIVNEQILASTFDEVGLGNLVGAYFS